MGSGWSNASPLIPIKFPSRTVDILFKDDVTVILLLSVSVMYSPPSHTYNRLENKAKVPPLIIIWLCVCVCQLLQAGGWVNVRGAV